MNKQEFHDMYCISEEMAERLYRMVEYERQQAIAEHEASEWKKYPEEKPEHKGEYLVEVKTIRGNQFELLEYNQGWLGRPTEMIIAFRELPKPYQEERQSFGSLNGCHNCKHQDNDDVCKKCDDTWDKWEGGEK